jgi:FkbM family methyltransferase
MNIKKLIPRFIKKPINFIYSSILEIDEPRRLKNIYSKFVKKGDLVFDIGGATGTHTGVLMNMGAKVISFEPNKNSYLKLKLINSQSYQIGIGSKNEKKKFYTFIDDDHSTFLKESPKLKEQIFKEAYEVNICTLKSQIDKFGIPIFIKVDVEGFEYEVLKTLPKDIKTIIKFEYTPSISEIGFKCIDFLSEKGFKFNYTYAVFHKFKSNTWLTGKELEEKLSKDKNLFGDIYAKSTN